MALINKIKIDNIKRLNNRTSRPYISKPSVFYKTLMTAGKLEEIGAEPKLDYKGNKYYELQTSSGIKKFRETSFGIYILTRKN